MKRKKAVLNNVEDKKIIELFLRANVSRKCMACMFGYVFILLQNGVRKSLHWGST